MYIFLPFTVSISTVSVIHNLVFDIELAKFLHVPRSRRTLMDSADFIKFAASMHVFMYFII